MDQMQIANKRRELEHARREKVREVMAVYDEANAGSLRELQDACGRIGHHWQWWDFGTCEDQVLCRACGARK